MLKAEDLKIGTWFKCMTFTFGCVHQIIREDAKNFYMTDGMVRKQQDYYNLRLLTKLEVLFYTL